MYKLTFKDKTVKLVSNEQGDAVKDLQSKGKAEYFNIDQDQYALKTIAKIEYTADPMPVQRTLSTGNRCKSKFSIHKLIYEEYCKHRDAGGKREWREYCDSAYKALKEKFPTKKWCDYKKGTCYCYSEQNKMVERAVEVMGGGEIVQA